MDANILKTAISSIMFVTEEDIRRLHAYNPKKEESRDVQYLLSLANIARNVSKSFASIENLIQTYMREIAGIDNKTWNRLISASVDIVENLAEMIRKNPTDFLQYIDLSGAAAKLEGREVFAPLTTAALNDSGFVSEKLAETDERAPDILRKDFHFVEDYTGNILFTPEEFPSASAIAAEISEQHRKEASV